MPDRDGVGDGSDRAPRGVPTDPHPQDGWRLDCCWEGIAVTSIYENGSYIAHHPGLHAEDSAWKCEKIVPLIDRFVSLHRRPDVRLLDALPLR